jgi:DNA-binding winged helix-turn-helix (wHTH) protein
MSTRDLLASIPRWDRRNPNGNKNGVKVKLRPQPFQVLKALVERAGDVLTRDELRELLWPKGTFVDFEHGLNAAISELRGVLNDTATDPRYIETLPKVGYRIKVPVELVKTHEPSGAAKESSVTTPSPTPADVASTSVSSAPSGTQESGQASISAFILGEARKHKSVVTVIMVGLLLRPVAPGEQIYLHSPWL